MAATCNSSSHLISSSPIPQFTMATMAIICKLNLSSKQFSVLPKFPSQALHRAPDQLHRCNSRARAQSTRFTVKPRRHMSSLDHCHRNSPQLQSQIITTSTAIQFCNSRGRTKFLAAAAITVPSSTECCNHPSHTAVVFLSVTDAGLKLCRLAPPSSQAHIITINPPP
ncbi:hypothetical protein M0R45_005873 [Rubus argutus]|uniref:Uncharacterized protein n=1 Tax=Rubus argutus TaxID=59490 RepID=A0AAW1YPF4_RUBAR